MTSESDSSSAFVDALLAYGGLLLQIDDHVRAFSAAGRSDPDAPPRDEILRTLVGGTLADRFGDMTDADLRTATRAVDRSVEAIEAEILLVPVEATPHRD
jgi:hypothetical protein